MQNEWIRCPACENKTRLQIREDTELRNSPLYCPKCKQETLIEAENLKITVIKKQETYSLYVRRRIWVKPWRRFFCAYRLSLPKNFLRDFCCLPCSCNSLSLFLTLSLSGGTPHVQERNPSCTKGNFVQGVYFALKRRGLITRRKSSFVFR